MPHALAPGRDDMLLVVDLQNDFCPGGSLAVPEGDRIVPLVNRLMPAFAHVALTQDWHPPGHASFAASHPGKQPFETTRLAYGEQTLWPAHCVQGTPGADFHRGLELTRVELVLRKGFRREVDSYSAFFENDRVTPTGLAGYLRERGIRRLYLVGLAFDFCVRWSAEDASAQGFEAVVIEDACRGIDASGSMAAARQALAAAGVTLLPSEALAA